VIVAFTVFALAAASGPAAPAAPRAASMAPSVPAQLAAAVPATERDWDEPPAGAPEDQALWHRLRGAGNDAVVQMGRFFQATFRVRYGKYTEGLAALEATGADGAARAGTARARLEAALRAADDAIPKQGLRVRVCRYTLRDLDQRMELAADEVAAAELPRLRTEAQACADEIGAFAARLAPRVEVIDAAIVAVDAALGRAPPQVPPYQSAQGGATGGTP
jgi:hypothetical protein